MCEIEIESQYDDQIVQCNLFVYFDRTVCNLLSLAVLYERAPLSYLRSCETCTPSYARSGDTPEDPDEDEVEIEGDDLTHGVPCRRCYSQGLGCLHGYGYMLGGSGCEILRVAADAEHGFKAGRVACIDDEKLVLHVRDLVVYDLLESAFEAEGGHWIVTAQASKVSGNRGWFSLFFCHRRINAGGVVERCRWVVG